MNNLYLVIIFYERNGVIKQLSKLFHYVLLLIVTYLKKSNIIKIINFLFTMRKNERMK